MGMRRKNLPGGLHAYPNYDNARRRARFTGLFLSLAALLAALPPAILGFGDEGHRVVGLLAEMHLKNSRALAEVRRILRPQETLADAAIWPDTIRNPLYEDGDTGLFRLEHPAQDTYHYTNPAFQTVRYDPSLPGARPTDVLQMTRECIRVLRRGSDGSSVPERGLHGSDTLFTPREALRLLAHLVGDIHQPLHVGNAYVSASGPLRFVLPDGPTGWRSSAGGNALVYGPQDRFNLHSYWDSHVVNLAMRDDDVAAFASRLMRELPVQSEWRDTGDPDGWPERWVNEGLVYAKDAHRDIRITTYLGPDENGRTPHRWRIEQPSGYDDRSRSRVRIQLAKGGYRLAGVLRAVWPE
jgi:S1/P1 Nuclease